MTPPLYVEVTPLLSKRLTGLGRFAARLVEALARRGPVRLFTDIDRAGLRNLNLRPELVRGDEIAVDAALPAIDGDLDAWTDTLLGRPRRPFAAGAAPAACCLYTFFRPAVRRFAREISMLYDFTTVVLPSCHEDATRRLLATFFSDTVRLSDKAIAISRSTQHDAGWLSAIAPQNVVVAAPGPSLCDRTHAYPGAPRARHHLLVVATREPRKNAAFLIDWFLHSPLVDAEAELWWVGPEGWMWDAAAIAAACAADARGRVRFLGMVSDARLCELYQRAACTICPSLYEGFGFPVLDSLCHRTPVLSSFNSALKEFAGPGVFYFDPCDRASLDEAYAALRAARPPAIDVDALQRAYSWDNVAATVHALCAAPREDRAAHDA